MKKALHLFLTSLHLLVCIFVMLGWLLPKGWLVTHAAFCVLLALQWQIFGGCYLTKFRPRVHHKGLENGAPFIKQIFMAVHHSTKLPMIQDRHLKLLIYGITLGSSAISTIRLLTSWPS